MFLSFIINICFLLCFLIISSVSQRLNFYEKTFYLPTFICCYKCFCSSLNKQVWMWNCGRWLLENFYFIIHGGCGWPGPGGQDINQEIKLWLHLKQQCLHKKYVFHWNKIWFSFISITICMYDGYGPNRMLTKCSIHKRLFVLYIFFKLTTFSIGHGWRNIITINRYTCCLLSWEGHWLGLVQCLC